MLPISAQMEQSLYAVTVCRTDAGQQGIQVGVYMYVLELGLSGSGLCGLYVGCG